MEKDDRCGLRRVPHYLGEEKSGRAALRRHPGRAECVHGKYLAEPTDENEVVEIVSPPLPGATE